MGLFITSHSRVTVVSCSAADATVRSGYGNPRHRFQSPQIQPPGPIHAAAFLNNGNRVVTVSMGMVRTWTRIAVCFLPDPIA